MHFYDGCPCVRAGDVFMKARTFMFMVFTIGSLFFEFFNSYFLSCLVTSCRSKFAKNDHEVGEDLLLVGRVTIMRLNI